MSNSVDNSNNDERHFEHSAETAEVREESVSDEFTSGHAVRSSMNDLSLESGIGALLAAESRDGLLASSRQEGDGAREVFAPAVVFGDLNTLVLGKISGELCRYDLSSFGSLTSSTAIEHPFEQELQRARKEAITMRYGVLNENAEYRSTFSPIEREEEDAPTQLGENPSEASVDAIDADVDTDSDEAIALREGISEEWAETRYSDEFLRDIVSTSVRKSESTECSVKPFSAYQEEYQRTKGEEDSALVAEETQEVSKNKEISPAEPFDAIDETQKDELQISEEETVELERLREEETVELRRNKFRDEGGAEGPFYSVDEENLDSSEVPTEFDALAAEDDEDSPLELNEEVSSPEVLDEDVHEGRPEDDTEVLDLEEESSKTSAEDTSKQAERIAEVRESLAGTMRLEAVTYVDEEQSPPPVRGREGTPAIPSQGPPPKHRPLPKEPVVSQVATAPPAPRASGRKSRPAGPPPKRRTTGEMRVERRTPPALSVNGEPARAGVPKRPPMQGPPNRPPQQGQHPGVGRGGVQQPRQPVTAAPKSSGDPQMDEIIQQLIDENNRKEVASAESGGGAPNARVEWFTNYFGDDYLRSISPKQQQRTKREIEFMLRSLRLSPGASILDAACGYGRHALEFAQRGYDVVGVDLSMTMLKRALNESNKRSAQLKKNLSVRFMQGDMRDIDYQSEFDCALLWQDSLGYFDNLGDADAISKIFNSLKPGGRFLLDVTNRDYVVPLLPTRRIWFGVQAEIHEEVFFDSQTSLLFMKRTYLTNNRGVVRDYLSRIRLYSLHELLNLLRYIGFNVLEVSGDILYRGHHLDHCSPRNIILVERPK